MSQNATVNVDIKLGVNKFHVDEGHPHIILAANPDINEFRKLMKACPAGLYKQDDAGNIHFDSAGCLECGTGRVLCGNTILEQWQYPAGTFGIEFSYGYSCIPQARISGLMFCFESPK
ncbi:putative ferredoxin [Escherichia coli]|nr:putative ferredoxin [Escherichia coli]